MTNQVQAGLCGGDMEMTPTSIPEVLWRDVTRRMKWWISITTRLVRQETMAILQPLQGITEEQDDVQCDDVMREIMRQRNDRHKARRQEERVKAQYIGTMLFLNGLQHEVRQWSREGPATAQDTQRKDVFGMAMGQHGEDLMFKNEMEGLPTPAVTRGQSILAICLGGSPGQPELHNEPTTRFEVIRRVCEIHGS